MRFSKFFILGALLMASVALTTTSWAATMLFSDQGMFTTAATNAGITLNNDGYEDLSFGPLPSPLARTGYTVSATNGTSFFGSSLAIDGVRSVFTDSTRDPILFSFDNPTNAFGIWLIDITGPARGDLGLTINDTRPLRISFPSDATSNLFIGVLDISTPFSSVAIERTLPTPIGGDNYGFDALQLGTIPNPPGAIPEPSTILLLGSGIAGLAWWRQRKPSVK